MAVLAPGQITSRLLRQAVHGPSPAFPRFSISCRPHTSRPLHTTAKPRASARNTQRPQQPSGSKGRSAPRAAPLTLFAAVGVVASLFALSQPSTQDEDKFHHHASAPATGDDRDPSLPRFRLSDVRKHDASSPNPWVTFEDKVYDITDWIPAHPGGDVILRAAGGSIEPYWKIFTIHNSAHVREILSQYLIGFIHVGDLVDGHPAAEDIEDPFEQDPVRDGRLITHTSKPRNAEPPTLELDREFQTPNELFYVRNHMWVPVVKEEEAGEHGLTVELPDGELKRYTLKDLQTRFKVHKVTAVLQCSGNRRSDMTRHAGKTNGLQWGVGAIGNAEWEGVRLADVLVDAGLKVANFSALTQAGEAIGASNSDSEDLTNPNTHHVQFSGLEAYGASIPLAKALDPRGDVILAFRMNGEPLPRDHGYPLRALVPGHVAARSVKWLSKIVISDEESSSQWQRRDYKSFGPNEGANPDWDKAPSIQEMPITSAITGVWVGECVRRGMVPWMATAPKEVNGVGGAGQKGGVANLADTAARVGFTDGASCTEWVQREPVALQGYAYSGGGRQVSRVDISLDGGKTWDQAELLKDPVTGDGDSKGNNFWAWRRWRYIGQLPALAWPKGGEATDGKHCTTVVVKATDLAYNSQPETHGSVYNVRGNLANAWHRVLLCPKCTRNGNSVTWSTGKAYGCGFKKDAEGGDKAR
ncbi:hypothetical protein GQ53DRAFT_754166 [Thozetella sp. PMI_491]|nr:hypothetical protein GQ53DRAFT_754166 [Thozetella sp. PMI_491]